MMPIGKVIHTLKHLKPRQIGYQLYYRLHKTDFVKEEISDVISITIAYGVKKQISLIGKDIFNFLNIRFSPSSWNDSSKGMLWAYNLNYMDYLLQPDISKEEGLRLIEKFMQELSTNKVGLDPYPIALRGINWIKWMAANGAELDEEIKKRINDSLYSQYRLLEKKLEWHLMGNHLLEDAYSLTIGAIYFNDSRMWSKASRILLAQLKEQVLDDGAHYEQSPMYHCILLDRLLDVINVSVNNPRFGDSQEVENSVMKGTAEAMLGHLENIVWNDGTIPLLNDSAYGIAPSPEEIRDYAKRLGLSWKPLPLNECGYRKLSNGRIEAVIDTGDITASYQPGHTHADTFNYELRLDGKPFIVDTGISTYDKTARRQYERGTAAHNTVTVEGRDSSEVWGGFRVGNRAKVKIHNESERIVEVSHDGYRPCFHTRRFEMTDNGFHVRDSLTADRTGVSRIHFAPGVKPVQTGNDTITMEEATIRIEGARNVRISDERVSTEYNRFRDIKVAEITFHGELGYSVIPNERT